MSEEEPMQIAPSETNATAPGDILCCLCNLMII